MTTVVCILSIKCVCVCVLCFWFVLSLALLILAYVICMRTTSKLNFEYLFSLRKQRIFLLNVVNCLVRFYHVNYIYTYTTFILMPENGVCFHRTSSSA